MHSLSSPNSKMSEPMEVGTPPPRHCPICLMEPEESLNLCSDKSHEACCRNCYISYIESQIHSAYMGTCPVINCPSAAHVKHRVQSSAASSLTSPIDATATSSGTRDKKRKRKLIPFESWKNIVPSQLQSKYTSLAQSLLAFLCGGCHAQKTLDLGYDSANVSQHFNTLATHFSASNEELKQHMKQDLQQELQQYLEGDIDTSEMYEKILKQYLPVLESLNDNDAWDIFTNVLKVIADPERRAALHVRYLKDRPRIRTLCCNREHCFHCKTKDFHENKSCMEHLSALDHTVVTCPACGIALAKGDGCNTITCFCGKQFSWSAEKENTERCQQFLVDYPQNTSQYCAELLCSLSRDNLDVIRAKAWQSRNRIAVNNKLIDWLKGKYPICTTQCCLSLEDNNNTQSQQPDGVKEAVDLWRQRHSKEYEFRRKQNDIALRSIFLTMCPIESERPHLAYQIANFAKSRASSLHGTGYADAKLIASANKWIESNRTEYLKGIEKMEETSARQFLYLFGNKALLSLKPSQMSCPVVSQWCRRTSNPELSFSNDDTAVMRVGSVSCYPAAFAPLPSDRSMLKVIIETASFTSNWLTFGLAARGLANSSSDGIGRSTRTWGISDDRSAPNSPALISSSGQEVASFRKLRVGDILSVYVDINECWCEVAINEKEFVYRFSIPPGSIEEYVFAMTFANDHKVAIIYEPFGNKTNSDTRVKSGELNPEHSAMYNCLKRQLKTIYADDDDITAKPGLNPIMTDGSKFLASCDGSNAMASERFNDIRVATEAFLGIKYSSNADDRNSQLENSLGKLSLNDLVEAISWYRLNRERLRTELRADLAYTFSVSNGEDAPFLAAMTALDYQNKRMSKDEAQGALSFMEFFQEEMNEWYFYDSQSRDPVIENVAKGCCCLPRHQRTCPLVQANGGR